MQLKAYVKATGASQVALARSIGVSKARLWNWIRGPSRPKAPQAEAIERATNGAVTAAEAIGLKPPRRNTKSQR
jgi:DNA-binding transcriptional regulator YdaS (Cro superfamily)